MRFSLFFKQSKPGQSGSEYALAIGLVAVVTITGLGAIGLNLGGTFSGMITSQPPAQSPGPAPNPPPLAPALTEPPASAPPSILATLPKGAPGTEPACFDSFCVNLPVIDVANEQVDTAGGNGVEKIHQFADVLTTMAQQVAAKEGPDSPLAKLISQLANDGHSIGNNQLAIVKNGGFIQANQNSLIGNYKRSQSTFQNSFETLNAYLSQHSDALSPTSKAVVNTQASQIKSLAEAVSLPVQGGNYYSKPIYGKAKLTHQSANTICSEGGENCHREI